MCEKNVIIVAGGKGLRMGSDLPKQFIPVSRRPVLMRTIEAFYNYDSGINIILVISPDYMNYWDEICKEYSFNIKHKITFGGETRYHSVKNGLALVESGLVAVHDAARPFVSGRLIENCFSQAEIHKAVIPAIDSTDSLRQMTDDVHSHIIDRSKIKLVQTPQVFDAAVLKNAYLQPFNSVFTDDASVVEYSGTDIHLVEGETTNIKITNPFDLKLAELILSL